MDKVYGDLLNYHHFLGQKQRMIEDLSSKTKLSLDQLGNRSLELLIKLSEFHEQGYDIHLRNETLKRSYSLYIPPLENLRKMTIPYVDGDGFLLHPKAKLAQPELLELAIFTYDKIYRDQEKGYRLVLMKGKDQLDLDFILP